MATPFILVSSPASHLPGGVTEYMRLLKPHFSLPVRFTTIGSRAASESTLASLLRLLKDNWRFATLAANPACRLVHINPSIGPKSFLRDSALLLIAKLFRRPVIAFAHGWDPAFQALLQSRLRFLFRITLGRADAFIVLGNRFRTALDQLRYRGPVFVLAAPVDESIQASQPDSQRHPFHILFLARIERDKGIYEALDAFRILQDQVPKASLTVAGDGSELAAASDFAKHAQLRGVSFVGHLDASERNRAFSQASAYLFPSHHEGMPLSVAEAMASGLPVVTTAVGALPDFFKQGEMGFMLDSPNPKALAESLFTLASNPELALRIGSFNRNYAFGHFTPSAISARLEEVYRLFV